MQRELVPALGDLLSRPQHVERIALAAAVGGLAVGLVELQVRASPDQATAGQHVLDLRPGQPERVEADDFEVSREVSRVTAGGYPQSGRPDMLVIPLGPGGQAAGGEAVAAAFAGEVSWR